MTGDPGARTAGRVIGTLILVLMPLGYVANFPLLVDVIAPPGFLVNAAPRASSIAVAALLGLAMGVLTLGIAVAAYPVLRPRSQELAMWFFGLSVAGLALAALESATLMSFLSLSEAYTKANVVQQLPFDAVGVAVRSSRNWAHFTHLLLAGATLFVFYVALFRYALVPRALGVLGIVATALQMVAIALPFFGQAVIFPLLAPLALAQLLLGVWLIAKGFNIPQEIPK